MLKLVSSFYNIPDEYLFSSLDWPQRYDILESDRTIVVCEHDSLALMIEEEYRCTTATLDEVMKWGFLKDICTHRENYLVLALERINEQILALLGILGFLKIDYYWAGVELLSTNLANLLTDDTLYEMEDDDTLERDNKSVIIQEIEEVSDTSGILLVSREYFQNKWFQFTPIFLRENIGVFVKDMFSERKEMLTIGKVMRISLQILRVLRRLTEYELVEILSKIPTISWQDMSEDQQSLFLYGVQDISTYIALQNLYLRRPIRNLKVLETSLGNTLVILETSSDSNQVEKHKMLLEQNQIQCTCTPYSPSLPCNGMILFLTKFRTYTSLDIDLSQIKSWLNGMGAINGLLHLDLIILSTAKRMLEYKFEGDREVFRLELTKLGREVTRHNFQIGTYMLVRMEFERRIEIGDNYQQLLETVLPHFPGNYTLDELIVLSVKASHRSRGALNILSLLNDLSFKYGLNNSLKRLRILYFKIKGLISHLEQS